MYTYTYTIYIRQAMYVHIYRFIYSNMVHSTDLCLKQQNIESLVLGMLCLMLLLYVQKLTGNSIRKQNYAQFRMYCIGSYDVGINKVDGCMATYTYVYKTVKRSLSKSKESATR